MPARKPGRLAVDSDEPHRVVALFSFSIPTPAARAGIGREICYSIDLPSRLEKEKTMTLVIYLVGWIILIGGVSWGLMAMHVAQHTIAIVAVILLGVAVITGATRARSRDRS
jgi:hypothetical protein